MLLKLAWGNVRKSARDFAIYFITIVLGVAVFYAFNAATDQQAVSTIGDASSLRMLLGTIVRYVSVFIAAMLAYLIIYANRFLMRRRSKEFGLYLVVGMRTSQVLAIVVLETLIIGIASLAVGFLLGFGLSQLILLGTASLFQETVDGFAMGFSVQAFLATSAVFGAIFAIAALMNARRIASTPLIDLLHADRKNEKLVLRSLPLSVALFALAIGCIGCSYHLLLENGLLEPSPEFLAATVLVCIGTWLFFFSLSGFLLRLIRWIRPLYLRGLNMFTMRQLNAKLNTTVASMTVVCMALFLSITSVCSGIGIVNAMNSSLEETSSYDVSVRTTWLNTAELEEALKSHDDEGMLATQEAQGPFYSFARRCNYDMADGLIQSARTIGQPDLAPLIANNVQVNRLFNPADPLLLGSFDAQAPQSLGDYLNGMAFDGYEDSLVEVLRLSEANAALELAGKEPIHLEGNQAAVIYNAAFTADFWDQFNKSTYGITVSGREFSIAEARNVSLETTGFPMDTGSLVLPDEAVDDSYMRLYSILDIQDADAGAQKQIGSIVDAIQLSDNADTWPVTMSITREATYQQTSGLTGIVAFLAIYIGFILTVACAAILAIQQLSEASDNAQRYRLLRKLGTPEAMVRTSLFFQVLVYFLAPLALALCHTVCAMGAVSTVIAVFGNLSISETALLTAGAFLATYGIYFLATFITARNMTR